MSKSILEEAAEISGHGGDRKRDYGSALENHENIAGIWNVQLVRHLAIALTAKEVVLMMIGLKLAREVNTPKRDNLVDIAGYVNCADTFGLDEYKEIKKKG